MTDRTKIPSFSKALHFAFRIPPPLNNCGYPPYFYINSFGVERGPINCFARLVYGGDFGCTESCMSLGWWSYFLYPSPKIVFQMGWPATAPLWLTNCFFLHSHAPLCTIIADFPLFPSCGRFALALHYAGTRSGTNLLYRCQQQNMAPARRITSASIYLPSPGYLPANLLLRMPEGH